MLPKVAKRNYGSAFPPIVEWSYHITPGQIFVKSERFKEYSAPSAAFIRNQSNLLNHKVQGELSQKAAKRMRTSIEWLVASAKPKRVYLKETKSNFTFKVNFITLTLAQPQSGLSDSQFKKNFLEPFIKRMKYHYKLRNYVWKAETQKNGNIHIHLTTDTFVHYLDIRKHWNSILYKQGLLSEFFEKHGHHDPNSTDVHSVVNVKNLAAYLVKYFSKNDNDRRQVEGRLWGCNYALSRANGCKVIATPDEIANVTKHFAYAALKHVKLESEPNAFGKKMKFGDLYYVNLDQWGKAVAGPIFECFREHIAQIRSGNDLFFQAKKLEIKEAKEARKRGKELERLRFIEHINDLASKEPQSFISKNSAYIQLDIFQ